MAPTRKTHRRTVPAKIGAKHTGATRRPGNASRPHATPTPAPARPAAPPGFLIVGIGASAGGLEAMVEFFRQQVSQRRDGLRGGVASARRPCQSPAKPAQQNARRCRWWSPRTG